jgi:hypothetical protein
MLKTRLRSRRLRKITDKPELFRHVCEKIKQMTGIDIKELDDIIKFKRYIQTRHDKLREHQKRNEKPKQPQGEKKTLIATAYIYAAYLGWSVGNIEEMRITTYVQMKNEASKKVEREQKIINDGRNKRNS